MAARPGMLTRSTGCTQFREGGARQGGDFQLVGQGKSTREVAQQLGLSPRAVDFYRANIREKLGLKDATALVRHAVCWVETQGSIGRGL